MKKYQYKRIKVEQYWNTWEASYIHEDGTKELLNVGSIRKADAMELAKRDVDRMNARASEEEKKTMKKATGFYNEKVMNKFQEALNKAKDEVLSGKIDSATISGKNNKMGEVASVSTLPFLTCPARCKGTCGSACYAAKIANMRPSVLTSYARNTALAIYRPELYWADVNRAMMARRFFRFHVSGDIMNAEYFEKMVEACRNNPDCKVLVFTKRYEIVNSWIAENGSLPENMALLFSGWDNLKAINPHGLPETTVYNKGDEPDAGWLLCSGNCFECGCRGLGCWKASNGDVIAFQKH